MAGEKGDDKEKALACDSLRILWTESSGGRVARGYSGCGKANTCKHVSIGFHNWKTVVTPVNRKISCVLLAGNQAKDALRPSACLLCRRLLTTAKQSSDLELIHIN